MDLTNKDRKQVVKAVLNGGGLINMVVRRRKSLGGRLVTPIHINLVGHKGMLQCYILELEVCLVSLLSLVAVNASVLVHPMSPSVTQTVALVWRAASSSLHLSRGVQQPGKALSQLETD